MAERAGVGIGTVSRVLNDSAGVADATRVRVRAVMDELGYRPSSTARNLSLGRTQTLGVIAPFFTSPSVVERLRGIDDVVGRSAYDLTLFNIETLDQRRAALRRFAHRDRVDGVIVISLPLTPAEVRALHRDGVPTVLVDVAHALVPHVAIDDVAGGAMAAGHLLAAGHRDIAFVGDVENNPFAFASSQRRLEGMRGVMGEAGVALPARYVRRGPYGRESALRAHARAAGAAPAAHGHLRGLRRPGLRRPRRGRARRALRARRPVGHRLRRHRARGGDRPDDRAPAAARVRPPGCPAAAGARSTAMKRRLRASRRRVCRPLEVVVRRTVSQPVT